MERAAKEENLESRCYKSFVHKQKNSKEKKEIHGMYEGDIAD
jgi:hypothetical protein